MQNKLKVSNQSRNEFAHFKHGNMPADAGARAKTKRHPEAVHQRYPLVVILQLSLGRK